jgi:hypothetical protein
MATGVIVAGAMAAYEPIIVIHRYYVYIGHQFVAIFATVIIGIAAIFADVVVTPYMVPSPL